LLARGGITNAMKLKEQALTKVDYQVITPLWESISDISSSISAEGTILYPEIHIKPKAHRVQLVEQCIWKDMI
jgi:hypothetical protein